MKKTLCILLTFLLLFLFCINGFADSEILRPGDADENGFIDATDLLRLKKYVAGQEIEINCPNSDVNGDTFVNTLDLIRFKRYLAGGKVILGKQTPKIIPQSPFSERYSNYLSFRPSPYALGIDVSTHNGEINWEKVKDYGVEFVFIRAGFRGYGEDTPNLVADAKFKQNIEGASAVGLPVGIYFYTSAINEEEAIEEANYVLDLIKGYDVVLPIAFDFEELNLSTPGDIHRASDLTAEQMMKNADAFIKTVSDAGYKGILYGSKKYFENIYGSDYLSTVYTWMANYTNECDTLYKGYFDVWQLASDGHVDGINGNVDVNIMYNCFY